MCGASNHEEAAEEQKCTQLSSVCGASKKGNVAEATMSSEEEITPIVLADNVDTVILQIHHDVPSPAAQNSMKPKRKIVGIIAGAFYGQKVES